MLLGADALARDITAASGNVADVAEVDALDEQAVQRHAGRLAEQVAGLDICFNAVGDQARLGTPLMELSFADFFKPITRLVTAQFTLATAVARHMIKRNSGVILTMTGSACSTPITPSSPRWAPQDCSSADEFGRPARSSFQDVRAWRTG